MEQSPLTGSKFCGPNAFNSTALSAEILAMGSDVAAHGKNLSGEGGRVEGIRPTELRPGQGRLLHEEHQVAVRKPDA